MASSNNQLYPPNEAQRLSALRRYDILDTPPERTFDRITAMAARLFNVPIAVISLVDESRIWFKSHHGLNVEEISRDPGLCASAILQQEPWILNDARTDERSRANPLVTGDFGLRFYVGIPLRTQDGFNIGMLCVLDQQPHPVSEAQIADLNDLAAIVMDQMELRLSTRRAIAGTTRLAGERETALELAALVAREYDENVQSTLELITGLLRHQSLTIEGSEGAAQLAFTANRVATIRRAHQHISAAAGSGVANVTEYLRHLCDDLRDVIGRDRVEELSVDGIDLDVAPRPLIAIGLIVNELVANAAKHGARRIEVLLERQFGGYALTVRDDGAGLPEGFDLAASGGFGMKIVLGQTQHLGGRVLAGPGDGGKGARFTISFPASSLD
jgi:two-component sensor histidine kinase